MDVSGNYNAETSPCWRTWPDAILRLDLGRLLRAQETLTTRPLASLGSASYPCNEVCSIPFQELDSGSVGLEYQARLTAEWSADCRDTYTANSSDWSIVDGNLPPGVRLSSTGGISGLPTTAGVFRFSVTANCGIFPTPPRDRECSMTGHRRDLPNREAGPSSVLERAPTQSTGATKAESALLKDNDLGGWSRPSRRSDRAHNPKVGGSNPPPLPNSYSSHGRCEPPFSFVGNEFGDLLASGAKGAGQRRPSRR